MYLYNCFKHYSGLKYEGMRVDKCRNPFIDPKLELVTCMTATLAAETLYICVLLLQRYLLSCFICT